MVVGGELLTILVRGVLSGSILALVAMGLTLIFGVMDLVNFAHGTYVMLSMYVTYFLWSMFGINPYLAILVVVPLFFVLGVISERIVIAPIIEKPMFAQVFATLGLLWVIENMALFLWGPTPRAVNLNLGGTSVLGIAVGRSRVYGFLITLAVVALLYLFLYRTKTGLAIRATAQSRELARSFGTNTSFIYMLTFGIGIALVGVAGSVVVVQRSVEPTTGDYFVLVAFVIVVLGGLGNISGALLGGFLIGVIESFVGFYFSPALGPPVYYLVFVLVLILRASGQYEEFTYRVRKFSSDLKQRFRGVRS